MLEGYFEADWKPVKKKIREHSNYHDTERDILSFRAFQAAHSVAVTQYGKSHRSGVDVPATDILNLIVCPCVTACSLFVSNERLWCQHLKTVGADTYVCQDSHKKKSVGRNLLVTIANAARSPWLPVCICGNHVNTADVSVERTKWKPVAAVAIPASDWQCKPRKKTTYVLDSDVSADTSSEPESSDSNARVIRKRSRLVDSDESEPYSSPAAKSAVLTRSQVCLDSDLTSSGSEGDDRRRSERELRDLCAE